MSVVRTADGSLVRRIDVPGAVHHVAVSPDGRFAVVTHPNEGGISAADLASYEVTASISTGPLPNYAIFSPDGGRLYVSNAGNVTVSEVDTARWIVLRNTLAGNSPEHMVLSHHGRRLYVANVDDGTVSEVVTESGATLRTFDIGGPLHGLDLSKNGRTLFIRALGQDKLVAINLHSLEKREAPLAPAPYHLASAGGTGKLYVSSAEQPNVWVVDQKDLVVLGKISIDAIEFNNAIACIDSFMAPLKRNSGVGSRPPPRPDASPISRRPSSPLSYEDKVRLAATATASGASDASSRCQVLVPLS